MYNITQSTIHQLNNDLQQEVSKQFVNLPQLASVITIRNINKNGDVTINEPANKTITRKTITGEVQIKNKITPVKRDITISASIQNKNCHLTTSNSVTTLHAEFDIWLDYNEKENYTDLIDKLEQDLMNLQDNPNTNMNSRFEQLAADCQDLYDWEDQSNRDINRWLEILTNGEYNFNDIDYGVLSFNTDISTTIISE